MRKGRSFVFNGENKQAKIIKDGKLVGEYDYNGEGQRVRKRTYDANGILQDTTVFVYSTGKLVAEYTTAAPPENPTTRYTATDMLGSPRVITDSEGNVIARRDFKPFGEEITNNTGERSAGAKYGVADNLKQKFTTYQRDDESGLDFAEARMYENRHGRFTAVDPLLASGVPAIPQTLNRFVYVANSPLALVDPSGLQAGTPEDDPVPVKVSTSICESFWCKIKTGFNDLFKLFVPNKPHENDERTEREERKRTGIDKVAKSAVTNWINGVEQLNEAMVEADPTGVANLVDKGTKNSVGLVPDEEVRNAGLMAMANTVLLVLTPEEKALQFAGKFVPYSALKAEVKAAFGKYSGVEVHHIIEQRFAKLFDTKPGDMLSMVVTKEEHQRFTKAWQEAIGYVNRNTSLRTDTVTRQQVEEAARRIYAGRPDILKALGL